MSSENVEKIRNSRRYAGNDYQLFGTRKYQLTDGPGTGSRCIDVRTGSGLEYTVACDRGMDLSLATYRGVNLVYLTDDLETNPAFYNPKGAEWLKTFSAGLLTTCGPTYLGSPCVDEGEELGLHGRYSTTPAREVAAVTDHDNGTIEITGYIHDAHLFGQKLIIKRTIRSVFEKPTIAIEDEITNIGGSATPLTMLYHMNFGYPFVDENAKIHVRSSQCTPNDEYTAERFDERFRMKSPDGLNLEKNYLHIFDSADTRINAWIWNRTLLEGVAVYLKYSAGNLPYMNQWMIENVRDYTAALEPANVPCRSRNKLREQGLLPMLMPGEKKSFSLEFGVIEGNDIIAKVLNAGK